MTESLEVRDLLTAAGFPASEHDIAMIEGAYQVISGMVALLYAVEEVRYESPAVVFDAEPTFVDW